MKRIICLSVFLLLLLAWRANCVTTQAQSLGVVDISLRSLTAAQVQVATSTVAGELIYCSNCATGGSTGALCISTSTAVNSFILSTGTVCK